MENHEKNLKLILFISLSGFVICAFGIFAFLHNFNKNRTLGSVESLSTSTTVTVETIVRPQVIQFKVHPEKRIPVVNNWDSYVLFQVLNCSTKQVLYNYTNVSTDTQGIGVINIPSSDLLLNGAYAFAIKEYSHLKKVYGCYPVITAGTVLDFTSYGDVLAGDTSVMVDNYVNSLDLSNTVRYIFTADYKNDLNQDGKVNSLDLSNIIHNLFVFGD